MSRLSRFTQAIAAADTFTDPVYGETNELVTIIVKGTWVGTLNIQYCLFEDDRTIEANWTSIVDPKTANGRWDIPGGGDWWRVGFEAGNYTSGTATFTIQA